MFKLRRVNSVIVPIMISAASLCGVVLAAEDSTNAGMETALLPWPPNVSAPPVPGTLLSAAIRALGEVNDLVIVVAGKNESAIAPLVYANGAFLVRDPAPGRGQFSSLQAGLAEVLNRGRDAAMITPVNCPPVGVETLAKLRHGFETAASQRKWAVIPEFNGKPGHPIIVGREMMEIFLRAPITATAQEIEDANRTEIAHIPVNDSLVTMYINTPEDYARLSSLPLSK